MPAEPDRHRDPRIAALRAELDVARTRTRDAVEDLESGVREVLLTPSRWPVLLAIHPGWFVGVAFTAGFLYGNRR